MTDFPAVRFLLLFPKTGPTGVVIGRLYLPLMAQQVLVYTWHRLSGWPRCFDVRVHWCDLRSRLFYTDSFHEEEAVPAYVHGQVRHVPRAGRKVRRLRVRGCPNSELSRLKDAVPRIPVLTWSSGSLQSFLCVCAAALTCRRRRLTRGRGRRLRPTAPSTIQARP